ncbi:small kinetochore-associated protein [Pleurodeles waltl]|uniref:small kinetochore-associated protein n=1 Tax=Pleurodeles waltl TaxID=8319 RepID=UPI003709B694
MESAAMDKSRIPVYGSQVHHVLGKQFSTDTQILGTKKAFPQKIALPLISRDLNVVSTQKIPDAVSAKATDRSKHTVPANKRTTGANRGPPARYKAEAELRDRNQFLEDANQVLQSELASTQETVSSLQERQAVLESEVTELNKRLERHMVILESRNIDPVTGNVILTSAEEMDKCRAETKLVTEHLMEELKNFSNVASEQSERILAIQSMCRAAEEERKHFLEKQKAFEEDRENFRAALRQAELLLDQ